MSSRIDEAGAKRVTAMIDRVRDAGLADEAKMFETAYWGWLRTLDAYCWAIPFVDDPASEGCSKASGIMHVTTYTIDLWAPLIPGSPLIDNEGVRQASAADEAWHREEDRRMRIEAGEDIL